MELKHIGLGLTMAAAVAASACMGETEATVGRLGATAKGGDDRSGPYDVVPDGGSRHRTTTRPGPGVPPQEFGLTPQIGSWS